MYDFTLRLITTEFTEKVANKLFEAGCNDALFYTDSNGVYLDFCRESSSLEEAISSAFTDIKKAGYNAEVQEDGVKND